MKRRRQSLTTRLRNAQAKNGELRRKLDQAEGVLQQAKNGYSTSVVSNISFGDSATSAANTARRLGYTLVCHPDPENSGEYCLRAIKLG